MNKINSIQSNMNIDAHNKGNSCILMHDMVDGARDERINTVEARVGVV